MRGLCAASAPPLRRLSLPHPNTNSTRYRDLYASHREWVEEVAEKMKPHKQARTEANAHYKGRRVKVEDESVPWSKVAPSYRPEEFTDDSVLKNHPGWADPPTPQEVTDLAQRKTYEAPISFDAAGMPLNPRGRTGVGGRGLLGRWGPNHAADLIVTRYHPQTGTLQLVALRREDTGQFAVPGGMSKIVGDKWNDKVRSTFRMEVLELDGDDLVQQQYMSLLLDDLFQGEDNSVVYRGCERPPFEPRTC